MKRPPPASNLTRLPPLSRRALLRGALGALTASVALPPLEAMLNLHGDALADGDPLPTPFGVWFWGNGVRPERWIPMGLADQWSPSEELTPLAPHRSHLSVLTGMTIKTGTHPHHAGMTGVMTGMPLHKVGDVRDTIISTFAGPSLDVIAARHFEGQTPLRSLELGVTRFRGTDEGTTFQHLSHNGPNNPNPSEYSPRAVFDRLFSMPTDAERLLARRSVLDLVRGQVGGLQRRLGASDRARLEQHLDSLRALEVRLAATPGACATPSAPSDVYDLNGQEQIEAQNTLMSDLLTVALACDLTRVFSVQFSTCGSGVVVWQAGATDGLHLTTHIEPITGTPATQQVVHRATTFTMSQLSYLLGRLRATPVGASDLLTQSSIFCTTEHTDGHNHSYADFPMMIAGLGGGRLRGDYVYRSFTGESVTKGGLTALRAAGVAVEGFGSEGGWTTETIGVLEA
jgi:hypothetical protein